MWCVILYPIPYHCYHVHVCHALYEKFIAIKYALRYKAVVTHRRVYQAIATSWIVALLFQFMRLVYELIVGSEYDNFPQFGSCSIEQRSALITVFTVIIPLLFAFLITIILDTYLSIKDTKYTKEFMKRMETGYK